MSTGGPEVRNRLATLTLATLTMGENHIKTNSIGLQLRAECWVGGNTTNPLFPLQSEHNRVILYF